MSFDNGFFYVLPSLFSRLSVECAVLPAYRDHSPLCQWVEDEYGSSVVNLTGAEERTGLPFVAQQYR